MADCISTGRDSFYTWNTERVRRVKSIDLAELVALKKAKIIWGKGYLFQTEDEKVKGLLKRLEENNNLYEFFFKSEKMLSALGFLIPCIDITETEEIKFNIATPWYIQSIGFRWDSEEVAEVWKQISWDNQNYFVRTSITKKEIKNDILGGDKKTLIIGQTRATIGKELDLPEVIPNKWGIITACFFQNVPKQNWTSGSNIGFYYPDATGSNYLQELLDQMYEQLFKELEYNRTRVFMTITPQEINQTSEMLAANGLTGTNYALAIKKLFGDMIINANLSPIEGSNGRPIEILQGDPKIANYFEGIRQVIKQYFEAAGLSTESESTAQKTESETIFTKTAEVETIEFTKTLRQRQWKRFIDKALLIMGATEEDLEKYSFEIKENSVVDKQKALELEERKIAMGISCRLRAIMKLERISEEEAIQLLEKIDKERTKDAKSMTSINEIYTNSMEEQQLQTDINEELKKENEQVSNPVETM